MGVWHRPLQFAGAPTRAVKIPPKPLIHGSGLGIVGCVPREQYNPDSVVQCMYGYRRIWNQNSVTGIRSICKYCSYLIDKVLVDGAQDNLLGTANGFFLWLLLTALFTWTHGIAVTNAGAVQLLQLPIVQFCSADAQCQSTGNHNGNGYTCV